MSRPVGWIIAVVVVGVLATIWLKDHDRQTLATATAKRSADSLRAVIAKDRSDRAAVHVADSIEAAARIRTADRQAQAARATATIAAGRYSALLDSLAAMAPDTLESFVLRLKAGWDEVRHRQDSALAAADTRVTARDLRIAELEADRVAVLAACDAQLDEAMKQLRAANDRARPGLLERARQIAPWATAFYLLGRFTR